MVERSFSFFSFNFCGLSCVTLVKSLLWAHISLKTVGLGPFRSLIPWWLGHGKALAGRLVVLSVGMF